MPKHIGIVAVSSEGAALCYRTICLESEQFMGEHDHPQISVHGYSLAEYMKYIDRDDWRGVGELMLSSAHKLKKAGAEFAICPDNTVHKAMQYMEPQTPLPWLHIAEVVAQEAKRRGFRKIGLTGTKYLVESEVYPSKLTAVGLEFARPSEEERVRINEIIFKELVHGIFTDHAVAYFQKVIGGLKQQGCDAVVLGCTEIPLIMNDGNSPLPTLDSTRLLARAAIRYSLEMAVESA
ncbi:MAG TPA: amino acid racemase [Terriglobales bacterium]|nr:amino acid racemase [Terriglobales bacterium]